MAHLLKTLETGTDFDICIFKSENKEGFITTTHDFITKKHSEIKYHEYYDEALNDAKHRIKQFAFNENKEVIKLSESQLYKIINESVTNILNEIGDTRKGRYKMGRVMGRQLNRGQQDDEAIISNMNSTAFRAGLYDEKPLMDKDYLKQFDNYLGKYERRERHNRYLERNK